MKKNRFLLLLIINLVIIIFSQFIIADTSSNISNDNYPSSSTEKSPNELLSINAVENETLLTHNMEVKVQLDKT